MGRSRGAVTVPSANEMERAAKRERIGESLSERPEGTVAPPRPRALENGAGNGIRTRDFDLGKVALYH